MRYRRRKLRICSCCNRSELVMLISPNGGIAKVCPRCDNPSKSLGFDSVMDWVTGR